MTSLLTGMTDPERTVFATVVIHEKIRERSFRGTLPNGRGITVFVEAMCPLPVIVAGDRVTAELSLGDFSRGKYVRHA